VCQTRLFGRQNQIGQPLKCPDCGAETILKAPVPEKAKATPAALEGDQYELWDADAAPLPDEIRAAQPKYIAVVCRVCGTLMHATESQIGQELTCPDCATRTKVVSPPAPRATRDVLASDSEDYQLDEAFAPVERPPVIQLEYKGMLYEQEREAELTRDAANAARGRKVRPTTDVRGRPIMPRWPLLSGFVPFLFSLGVLVRWFALSAIGGLAIVLGSFGIGSIGAGDSEVSTDMSAVSGVYFLAIGCVIGIFWVAAFASIFIAVVTESSEGNDQVHHWPPPSPAEWLPELIYFLVAAFASSFPGWLLAQSVASDANTRALSVAGSAVLFFPIMMLSQLDIGSPFAIISRKVLASTVRFPFSWLLLYLESGLLVTGCILVHPFTAGALRIAALLLPLSVAAALVYARLLGRLAWKLAEAMPTVSADERNDP
jgi:DNA-directed RNA polymerase subunit M/transcription elongation factor TFIIS